MHIFFPFPSLLLWRPFSFPFFLSLSLLLSFSPLLFGAPLRPPGVQAHAMHPPGYATDKPVRALRSSDKHLLTVPRTSSTLGDRAFSVAAPTLWNSLPLDIRRCDSLQSFKTFKTHLYNKVYN